MDVAGDVKCYHCGHVSGQIEGTRTDRLVLRRFKPRPGYRGPLPRAGERIRCDRCQGPVYLEDLRPVSLYPPVLETKPAGKKGRSSRTKAA